MESINPYQPPEGDGLEAEESQETERPIYDTRWQATRAGMRRGAVAGMTAATIVFLLLLGWHLMSCYFGWLPSNALPEIGLRFFLEAVIIIPAGGFICGAIPGGIIIGLIEAIRFRNPK